MDQGRKKLPGRDITRPAARVIAGLLAEKGVDQRELSARLGKRPNWANLLVREHYKIKLQDLFDICDELDTDVKEIMTRIILWKDAP